MIKDIKIKYGPDLTRLLADPDMLAAAIIISIGGKPKEKQLEKLKENGIITEDGKIKKGLISIRKEKAKDPLDLVKISEIKKQDIPERDMEYYDIAVSFQTLFISNLESIGARTNIIKNALYTSWVKPIRLMIQEDGVTVEQLKETWKFLDKHYFWSANVQSTEKLREKFQTIYTQSRQDAKRKTKQGTSKEYIDRIIEQLKQ